MISCFHMHLFRVSNHFFINPLFYLQARGLTPAFSKRLLTFIQDAMPLRLKEVHFVKQPMVFSVVWAMFKPFIREKLKTRVSDLQDIDVPSIEPSYNNRTLDFNNRINIQGVGDEQNGKTKII